MTSARDDTFCIELAGAEPASLRRGLAAAHAVFDLAGVDPHACQRASYKRESRTAANQAKVSEQEHDLADLWWEAAEAAWSTVASDWEGRQPRFAVSDTKGKLLFGTPCPSPADDAGEPISGNPATAP